MKARQPSGLPEAERARRILRARAEALAAPPSAREETDAAIEVIEFVLAYERYAVESAFVREIQPLKSLTPVPCTPEFVRGIVNLRGEILSVIDIKKFFELPEKGLPDLNKVIVLRSDAMEFGILADQILGVRMLRAGQMQASLPTLTGIRAEYLKGVTAERVVVLDAAKLLADRRIVVHEQVNDK